MQLRKVLGTILAVAAVAVTLVGFGAPAQASNIGNEGCTPGYWKNHTDNWEEAQPTDLLATKYSAVLMSSVAGVSMLEALGLRGGPGVSGAERILARAATAAYLNAAHEGVGYPWRRNRPGLDGRPALVPTVNAAYDSDDRATMLDLATRLDNDNNLGCPL